MADFWICYERMLNREGGYKLTNKKTDTGKQTFAGISRRWHPNWEGWAFVDRGERQSKRLRTAVVNFYIREFWRPISGNKIADQEVADEIFSFGVNANWDTSARIAQGVCGAGMDGKIGPKTLRLLNRMTFKEFGGWFFVGKVAYYASVVDKNEKQAQNFHGWMNRALDEIGVRSNG